MPILSGVLSGRMLRKDGCRSTPSPLASRYSMSATSTGSTHHHAVRATGAEGGSSSGLVSRRISSKVARRLRRLAAVNPVPTPPIQWLPREKRGAALRAAALDDSPIPPGIVAHGTGIGLGRERVSLGPRGQQLETSELSTQPAGRYCMPNSTSRARDHRTAPGRFHQLQTAGDVAPDGMAHLAEK